MGHGGMIRVSPRKVRFKVPTLAPEAAHGSFLLSLSLVPGGHEMSFLREDFLALEQPSAQMLNESLEIDNDDYVKPWSILCVRAVPRSI